MSVKSQRYTAFWLYTIFALIIPILLVLEKFNFFSDPKGKSLGLGAIIILFLVVFYFRKHITLWIDEMDDCIVKFIFKAIRELSPLLICYGVFAFMSIQFVNITFIMKWSCVSNLIAIFIRVWHLNCIKECNLLKESKGE